MSREVALASPWIAVCLGVLGLVGCGSPKPGDDRLLVVVSVAPQRYVVQQLAGELVRVEVMIPPGASPATYEPTLQQLRGLDRAELYVKVGHPHFPFEASWLQAIVDEAPSLRVVDASAGIPYRDDDPHLWVAPRHVEQMAIAVAGALEDLLPTHREALRRNLAELRERIDRLDVEIRAQLDGRKGREFFVFHPAWGYFAEAYGLRQIAVEEDHKEPSPAQLAKLIRRAKESGVRVIFVQPQFDPKGARVVAREVGARIETLDPLAEDWESNLRDVSRALDQAIAP